MILSVPIPALFVYEITAPFLSELPQTLIDGSSASAGGQRSHGGAQFGSTRQTVYGVLAMIPPIAPFAPQIHGRLNFPVIVVFIAATLLFHPSTQTAPMKVRFLQ